MTSESGELKMVLKKYTGGSVGAVPGVKGQAFYS